MSVRPDVELRVFEDAEAVAAAAAQILAAAARLGGQIALSGGSTPKRAYRLAAEALADWSSATLWLGDERHVPADDERSNARMVAEQLLAVLPPAGRPRFEAVAVDASLHQAAADYDGRLRSALHNGGTLDLAIMGIGPDAHTASLFPGKPAVEERRRWVVEVREAGMVPWVPRVTMTLPVFDSARDVVFLAAGADKAPALARAFADPPDPVAPSGMVRVRDGRLLVLADRAAVAELAPGR
jgi:6-phosphogluconolactonase